MENVVIHGENMIPRHVGFTAEKIYSLIQSQVSVGSETSVSSRGSDREIRTQITSHRRQHGENQYPLGQSKLPGLQHF